MAGIPMPRPSMPRPPRALSRALALLALASAMAATAVAAAPGGDGDDFFERRIRPLLADRCFGCHSAAAPRLRGGLRLDTRDGLRRGGESGPAVLPGDPAHSRLLAAVRRGDPDLSMPPKDKEPLTASQVADLEHWIAIGAPDPRTGDATPPGPQAVGTDHWAFRPPRDVTPPGGVRAGLPDAVDAFLEERLARVGLRFAPPAAPRTWLRRVTFDLTGLPPTPEETAAFLADRAPGAEARVIDRLLASPRYGEKWGRLWLDVVRYADTSGCNADYPVPTAYLYRNWVVDAFNADKPYDRFLAEQLAGDLMPAKDDAARRGQVVATGYLAISRRFGSRASEFHLTIEDTIDNLGKSMLGLSVNCARCHDHKFDPVGMADYYALYGIFASTRYAFPGTEIYKHPKDHVPLGTPAQAEEYQRNAEALAYLDDLVEKLLERKRTLDRLTNAVATTAAGASASPPAVAGAAPAGTPSAVDRLPPQLAALLRVPATDAKAPAGRAVERKDLVRIPDEWSMADVKGALFDAQAEQKKLERKVFDPALVKAYAVADGPAPADARIQRKGDPSQPGDPVRRGFLRVLGGQALPEGATGSGRLELASWIADASNPLTARVMVNRIWQGHFGRGLVATPNDFGRRGQAPSHPELLDWLARRFVESGWSVKAMHRALVLSRAYRQGNAPDGLAAKADPEGRLLSGFPRRRLSAEELRDATLFVAGTLDLEPGGAHPFPRETEWTYTQHTPFVADYPTSKRSVYLFQQRFRKNPYLELFDGPDPNATTPVRGTATSPLQALAALNSRLNHEAADALAVRVGMASGRDEDRLRRMHELAWGRGPTAEELKAGLAHLHAVTAELAAKGEPAERRTRGALASHARVLLGANEFVFVD